MVASLRDTISGLRAAGDVEGRLKAQVMALHGQAAAAQAAQVRPPCIHCRQHAVHSALKACSWDAPNALLQPDSDQGVHRDRC